MSGFQCISKGVCGGGACAYHEWVSATKGDVLCGVSEAVLPVAMSRMLLAGVSGSSVLRRVGVHKRQKIAKSAARQNDGTQRLVRFLRLSRLLGTAPWANKTFAVNEAIFDRLTAAHLGLICGADVARQDRQLLLRLLASRENLANAENLCWITNRQQGKTTTVGKFLACLALCGRVSGLLATVYSTSLDRAQELVKSCKQYLYWYSDSHGDVKFLRDTDRMFVLRNVAGFSCEVAARPKNTDSCRGDAPASAFFDEIGFVQENFWYKFAYPLLQVSGRVFTCITTPPPRDGFFSVFTRGIQERNSCGDYFFTFVNHSLACGACVENSEAERCTHRQVVKCNVFFFNGWLESRHL
jgi:hypothetical protein